MAVWSWQTMAQPMAFLGSLVPLPLELVGSRFLQLQDVDRAAFSSDDFGCRRVQNVQSKGHGGADRGFKMNSIRKWLT